MKLLFALSTELLEAICAFKQVSCLIYLSWRLAPHLRTPAVVIHRVESPVEAQLCDFSNQLFSHANSLKIDFRNRTRTWFIVVFFIDSRANQLVDLAGVNKSLSVNLDTILAERVSTFAEDNDIVHCIWGGETDLATDRLVFSANHRGGM